MIVLKLRDRLFDKISITKTSFKRKERDGEEKKAEEHIEEKKILTQKIHPL